MLGVSSIFAQMNATFRLEMPAVAPNPGEDFFVELWLDVLDYPAGVETMKSCQIGLEYDEANVVAVSTGPPFNRHYYNHNQMFIDYGAPIADNVPNPGDLRYVFYTTVAPGLDPSFYGGIPMKLWDIKFNYVGGDISISFSEENALKSVEPFSTGGKLATIATKLSAWDDLFYDMTFVNIVGNTGTPGLWTGGATSGNWFLTGNWDDGIIPTATTDVTIPAGTPHNPVIDNFIADCQAMQIDAGAELHIMDAGGLTATGLTTNNGLIMMHGNNIGGSLIDNGFAGAGTFEYARTLTSGAPGTHFGWHYVSSPVNNTMTGDFVGYWVKNWNEAGNTFTDIDPWVDCTNPSAFNVAMMAGMGYSVKQDLNYTGTTPCPLPTGVIGDVITFGGDYMTGTPYGAGFTAPAMMANVNTGAFNLGFTAGGSNYNLLGNPYPSAIDWDAVTIPAGLNDAVYYWDENMDQYATYIAGAGTNGGTNEVPPTQGFFVDATANGTLALDNSMRVHGLAQYYKSDVNDIVRLVASANNFSDETVIRFTDEATAGFDKQFDAKKLLSGGTEVPSLYTHAGSDIISINSQPAVELVPMSFTCSISGTYEIAATETSEFSHVVLEDILTGEQHDLLTGAYTFDYTVGENVDRFIVHFTPLGTIENSFDNITIWSNENNIYVNVPSTVKGDIVVVNMMGQEVLRTDIAPGMNILPVDDVNTYYVVQVIGSEDVKTGKVYIK